MKIRRTIKQLNVDFKSEEYTIMEQYVRKNHTNLIIEDSNGYRFDVDLSNLRRGKKCIVGTQNKFSLYNIGIWLEINNKPFRLSKNRDYVGSLNNLLFHCLVCHKEFLMTWAGATQGRECFNCQKTKGERRISEWLDKTNIDYVYQKRFDDCRNINTLPFDFGIFLNKKWKLIEFQGGQHYFPVDFFGEGIEKAKLNFKEQVKRDKIKKRYCKDNNIRLIVIPYWKYEKIESILNKEFNK